MDLWFWEGIVEGFSELPAASANSTDENTVVRVNQNQFSWGFEKPKQQLKDTKVLCRAEENSISW